MICNFVVLELSNNLLAYPKGIAKFILFIIV